MSADEFTAELDKCTGLDDPRWRAVELLAGAWQPALAAAQRLGYDIGYTAGYWAAEHDMADAWHEVAEKVRELARRPTLAELAARRGAA